VEADELASGEQAKTEQAKTEQAQNELVLVPLEQEDAPQPPAAQDRNSRLAVFQLFFLELALPLGLFYGLIAAGVNQWAALVASSVILLAVMVIGVIRERKIELLSLFTLSMIAAGTIVSLLTGNPRLLLARESYITGVLGVWMIGTLYARRPFIFETTTRLMPLAGARAWERAWQNEPKFRGVMRAMTVAWGASFIIDAGCRIVMAYTLPVDIVPLLSIGQLVLMLIIVVQGSKWYGARHLSHLLDEMSSK
jgi:hypothetical protein